MSVLERITARLGRSRDRFRYEVLQPRVPVSDIYSELAPGVDVDLLAPDGFARLWAAHATATPQALWLVAPAPSGDAIERTRQGDHELLARTIRVTPETDWHHEPVHGVHWPRVHVDSCPFTMPGADIEILWQLGHMDFLVECAAAYRATGDERFAARATALLDSWARANPYLVGVNWIAPMHTGIRLFAWSAALSGISAVTSPANEVCERILRSVLRQAEFLARHFSNWPIPNNHLIGEAATLAAFSAYWPLFKRSRMWMAQADTTLVEEAKRQILKDGFQFENSVNYHMVTLDFFLLYLHAKLIRGETPPALVLEKTLAMAEAALALPAPSGRMPMIGDDSTLRLMVLSGVMGSPGPIAGDVTFEDFLRVEHARLFSTSSWGRDLLALRLPVAHARRFEDAGIDVVRAADAHVVFTHGPQHHRPYSHGHLHADAGSFELELDGSPLIVDSGTCSYGTGTRLRRHMRSARAHNTVLIDGVEPMNPAGAFQWDSVLVAEPLGFGALDDIVAMGCRRRVPGVQGPGVDHTRTLVCVGSTVIIADTLSPRSGVVPTAHAATIYFHTVVAAGAAAAEGMQVRLTDAARFVRVFEVLDEPRAQVDLIDDPHDLAALYSPAYGESITGTTIRVSIPVQETVSLVCVLRSPEVSVTRARTRIGQIGCAIEGTHARRIVSLRPDPFGVFVGGQAVVATTGLAAPRRAAPAPDSMEWLDEIDA
jgi:hypothetical protein